MDSTAPLNPYKELGRSTDSEGHNSPRPHHVPTLVEIIINELMRHKSKIVHLNDCSVADATPVLVKLPVSHLLSIEESTERDLKLDPNWDELWEIQCSKLSIPQAKNRTWRETWALAESKRKKYASSSVTTDTVVDATCMTAHQVGIMKARQEWQRKVTGGPTVVGGPPRKKSKYR